jgi:hypothetical protein
VRLGADPELVDPQILPSGPSVDNDNNLKLFAAMIQNARRRISVTSPYYVPDETIQMALVTAGSRGLDVELFVSEIGDQFMVFHAQRSYYEQLLRAGVKIYLYRAPTILHAKHLSIDDDVAVIGSSNLDIRSLSLHMELSVLVHGTGFTSAMRAVRGRLSSEEPGGSADGLAQTPAARANLRQPDAVDVLAAVAGLGQISAPSQLASGRRCHRSVDDSGEESGQ